MDVEVEWLARGSTALSETTVGLFLASEEWESYRLPFLVLFIDKISVWSVAACEELD